MRKKALIILAIVVAIVIATTVVLCVCLIGSPDDDTFVDENGVTVVAAKNGQRVETVLNSSRVDKLEIMFASEGEKYSNFNYNDNTNRKRLIFNGNNKSFHNVVINTNARNVVIKDIVIENDKPVAITVTGANAYLILENCTVIVSGGGGTAVNIISVSATVDVEGYSELHGGKGDACQNGGSALVANYLTVLGNGKLSLFGGKAGVGIDGDSGVNGTSYSTKRETVSGVGSDGTAGGHGTNGSDGKSAGMGGDALRCDELSVRGGVQLYCQGGDGSRSGNGGSGGRGGDGSGAKRPSPFQFKTYEGGRGGNGGSGGAGADEQRAGYGIVCDSAKIDSSKVTAKCGTRGAAGAGGSGGSAGRGGEDSGGSLSEWGGTNNAPDGQAGRNGAAGEPIQDFAICNYYIEKLEGKIYE